VSGPPSPRGSAVLFAGPLRGSARRFTPALATALAELETTLGAAGSGWNVRTLGPGRRGPHAPTADNLVRAIRGLSDNVASCRATLLVVIGSLVGEDDDAPAVVTDTDPSPDATSTGGALALAMLRPPDRRGVAPPSVSVFGGWTDRTRTDAATGWLDACAGAGPDDLVVASRGDQVLATLEWLRIGLAGAALDASTGDVTPSSLGAFLARSVPGLTMRVHRPPTISASSIAGSWVTRLTCATAEGRSAETVSAPDALLGTTLPGQFRLDAVLGRGGFGTVYRARQLAIERDVAIKVVHGNLDMRARGGLFVQEIQAVGRIDHPNVVRILHADLTPGGHLFYAMELLHGVDLEAIVATGTLPPDTALRLARQILEGLAAAHDAGLVHADLKPANVVVVPGQSEDRAVLVDFGLARLHDVGSSGASVGGTPAYMAPEQLEAGRVDVRSDVFSTGLVLVTLLTGWRRRRADELAPTLEGIDDPGLRQVLARALAIDPADRYPTARDFADALAMVAEPQPRADAAHRTSHRRGGRVARMVAPMAAVAAIAAALAVTRPAPDRGPRKHGAGTIAGRSTGDAIIVGGSGTVMWGFIAPLNAFLESASGAEIPVSSKYDAGSGGALRGLIEGVIDVAGFSARYEGSLPKELSRSGRVLVEVAIGFDETTLFVRPPNPLRTLDIAGIRAHLCCAPGQSTSSLVWKDLGVTDPVLTSRPVTWVMFGRRAPTDTGESTSATLRLADDWLCRPHRLCPSPLREGVQADEMLAAHVKDEFALALSSRSFATAQVVPVAIVDGANHTHLDGRKTLWLYLMSEGGAPLAPRLCRFLAAVLDPETAGRLAASGKAIGLPDAVRQRQRVALGLDDGSCAAVPTLELAGRVGAEVERGVVRSPIASEVAITERWIPDSRSAPAGHDAAPGR